MRRFMLGVIVGAWAMPLGMLVGAVLCRRNLIDPVVVARPVKAAG